MMQFVPENGIYVYFRYNKEKTVMVVMNSNEKEEVLKTDRFAERTGNYKSAKNIITNEKIAIETLKLPAKTTYIFELQ
jgi:hypothetical protein